MLPLYIGSLALGGVLIVASIVLGDTDTDAGLDADVDLDVDLPGGLDGDQDGILILKDPADAMADAGTWLPFFSLRFWTFALATFGASGILLNMLGVGGFLAAGVSICLGGAIGTGAAWIFRTLQLVEPTGNVGLLELSGTEATVLLQVGPEKVGKIRLRLDEQYVDLPARTQGTTMIDREEKALILDVKEGVALITPVPAGYKSLQQED